MGVKWNSMHQEISEEFFDRNFVVVGVSGARRARAGAD
jgi:hypothetical protein